MHTFLCTRSIEPLPETEVITELLVSWGPPPRGYETVEFPLNGTGGSGSETKTDGEEKKEENRVVCNLCYRKATVEEDLSASDREAEEYRMAEIARERERMAAQRDRIVSLRNELSHLRASNEQLAMRLALVMARHEEVKDISSSSGSGRGSEKGKTNTMETERRYLKNLQQWADQREQLDKSTNKGNRAAMELQLRLDDKEPKGMK